MWFPESAVSFSDVFLIDDDVETVDIAEKAGCKIAWLPTKAPNVVKTSSHFDGNENKWCEAFLLENLKAQLTQQ